MRNDNIASIDQCNVVDSIRTVTARVASIGINTLEEEARQQQPHQPNEERIPALDKPFNDVHQMAHGSGPNTHLRIIAESMTRMEMRHTKHARMEHKAMKGMPQLVSRNYYKALNDTRINGMVQINK